MLPLVGNLPLRIEHLSCTCGSLVVNVQVYVGFLM
jgi:hypothetical protein